MEQLNKKVDKIFNNGSIPPIYGNNFSKGNLSWKRIDGIEFENIGRILICHLLIETHLNKLIELQMPKGFDIDAANLTFSQKLKMLQPNHIFKKVNFHKGITTINKIRNKFSHNIEAFMDHQDVEAIKLFLIDYDNKNIKDQKVENDYNNYSNLAIIEDFTSLFCAYCAGYCSAIVEKW